MAILALLTTTPTANTQANQPRELANTSLVQFDTTQPTPIQVTAKPRPDFDRDVLTPLKTAQAEAKRVADEKAAADAKAKAEAAAAQAAAAQAQVQQSGTLIGANTGDVWYRLRMCESGNNYANRDTGHNGHYGAYQFSLSTWAGVGGSGNPADASPAEQDMRAQMLQARYGWGQWECKV